MAEKEAYDKCMILSTGAVVRLKDHKRGNGVVLHFINPLLAPHDIPAVTTWDNEHGKNTSVPIGDEATMALMQLLMERYHHKKDQDNGE